MTNPIRRTRAALVALALTLALATPSLAANQVIPSPETLTVLPTTTLTGVPVNIDYGSTVAGMLNGTAFTLVAGSNATKGVTLSIDGSTGGLSAPTGGTIARSNRKFVASAPTATCTLVGGASSWASPGKALGVSGGLTICNPTTGPVSNMGATITPAVLVPVDTPAGAYVGSLVISLNENP